MNTLYNEALTHNSFVPGCGETIGVLMYEDGVNYCTGQSGMQVLIVEQTVDCGGGGSDTMWGFNIDENGDPISGESCRFVGSG